jgi:hypothetical protein
MVVPRSKERAGTAFIDIVAAIGSVGIAELASENRIAVYIHTYMHLLNTFSTDGCGQGCGLSQVYAEEWSQGFAALTPDAPQNIAMTSSEKNGDASNRAPGTKHEI